MESKDPTDKTLNTIAKYRTGDFSLLRTPDGWIYKAVDYVGGKRVPLRTLKSSSLEGLAEILQESYVKKYGESA